MSTLELQLIHSSNTLFGTIGRKLAIALGLSRRGEQDYAAELLERAAEYEKTQPSFAADLRAAAVSMRGAQA